MPKYFQEEESFKNDTVIISGDNFHHLIHVLRTRIGQSVEITNKATNETFNCSLIEINKENAIAKIINKIESKENDVQLYLFQAIPKENKMDYIIQKCTELGVSNFIPLKLKYCVGKVDEKKQDKKMNKWNNIVISASKQSRRDIIPNVYNPVGITSRVFLDIVNDLDYLLLLNENENKKNLNQVIKDIKSKKDNFKNRNLKIGIIVGAEGGISSDEVSSLKNMGAISISLGRRILRCETAPLVIVSILNYEFEEF